MGTKSLRKRWNLTQVVGKMRQTASQRGVAVDSLFAPLRDVSLSKPTFELQVPMDQSAADPGRRPHLLAVAEDLAVHGTAVMRARARRLLAEGTATASAS